MATTSSWARTLPLPLLLVATLLTATPVTAVHVEAPQPDVDSNVLFAHFDEGGDEWYLATITGEEMGTVGGRGTSDVGTTYSWTIPLGSPLVADLLLDPEGTVDAYAYIGRTGTGGVGRVTATSTFSVGDTVIAEGSGQTIVYAHEYQEIHWSVAPAVDRIPADGGDVVWTVSVTDGARNGVFLRLNDPDGLGASRVELPITGVEGLEPDVLLLSQDLTGSEVNLTLPFTNATNAVHQYTWTATGDAYDLHYAIGVTNGSLDVRVDADGIPVFNETYASDVEGSVEGAPFTGNLTIRLGLTSFEGDIVIRIVPPPSEIVEEEPATEGNETAGGPAGNETAGEEGGGIPNVGAAAALAGVVALAVAKRRRC